MPYGADGASVSLILSIDTNGASVSLILLIGPGGASVSLILFIGAGGASVSLILLIGQLKLVLMFSVLRNQHFTFKNYFYKTCKH